MTSMLQPAMAYAATTTLDPITKSASVLAAGALFCWVTQYMGSFLLGGGNAEMLTVGAVEGGVVPEATLGIKGGWPLA